MVLYVQGCMKAINKSKLLFIPELILDPVAIASPLKSYLQKPLNCIVLLLYNHLTGGSACQSVTFLSNLYQVRRFTLLPKRLITSHYIVLERKKRILKFQQVQT